MFLEDMINSQDCIYTIFNNDDWKYQHLTLSNEHAYFDITFERARPGRLLPPT